MTIGCLEFDEKIIFASNDMLEFFKKMRDFVEKRVFVKKKIKVAFKLRKSFTMLDFFLKISKFCDNEFT